jgi:hypothetical protein
MPRRSAANDAISELFGRIAPDLAMFSSRTGIDRDFC